MPEPLLHALLGAVAAFAATWWVADSLLERSRSAREVAQSVLGVRSMASLPSVPAGLPSWHRVAALLTPEPLRAGLAGALLVRPFVRSRLQARVVRAGMDDRALSAWTEGAVGVTVLSILGGGVLGAAGGLAVAISLACGCGGAAAMWAWWHLGEMERTRRERLRRELPLAVDVIAAALKVGASVDRAMRAYALAAGGDLAAEFRKVIADLEAGYRRSEAYARVAARLDLADLRRVLSDLQRLQEQGTVDPAELRAAASDLRTRQRQAIQARAMRAPVNMLFPIAFFIMPAMFVVVLGPVIVGLITGTLFAQ